MSATFSAILLSNASATSGNVSWPGGLGVFTVTGTFSGATVKLQCIARDGTALDVGPDTTLTAGGMGAFTLPPCLIKATITGGPPSGIYADVAIVPS